MRNQLIEDAQEFPELFDLKLPASPQEIAGVEKELGARLPPSFRDVLETLGQGSLFDNETLLGVHEADEGTGDLVFVNREIRDKQGLSEELIVFHIGTGGLHAFDTATSGPEWEVVALDEDTLAPGTRWESFEAWYQDCMRGEYASILGLD